MRVALQKAPVTALVAQDFLTGALPALMRSFTAVFILSFTLIISGCVWNSNRAGLNAAVEVPFQSVRRVPSRFDFIEDRALPIAEVLDNWNVSDDEWTLLSLAQLIIEKSDEIGVSPALTLAMIETESTFDPCAVSRVGAKGLMQVMPARILGRNHVKKTFAYKQHLFYDPHWNIAFGMDYLGYLIERFDRLDHAIAAYNLGPTRMSYRLRSNRYNETRYVRRILKRQERYELQLNPQEPLELMQIAQL